MFDALHPVPLDPLLGLIEKFRRDDNPAKIDLGVGVYKNDQGQTPVLASVKRAEAILLEEERSKAYLGALGDQSFNRQMSALVLGDDSALLDSGRIAALQTPGGCGALRVAAELIVRARPGATVWVSDPTWANHVPLLGGAGVTIASYPYYDYRNHSLRFDAMLASLESAAAGDLVLLHGCCHNPCGADLSVEQWRDLAQLLLRKGLLPFVDLAYQGFGESVDADAFGLRHLASTLPETLFALSCSKNFGLYRERVGLVGLVAETPTQAQVALGNMAQIVRGLYSMPPAHGAAVVDLILSRPELRAQWLAELDEMRQRIQAMRSGLVRGMGAHGLGESFGFIESERGMFSFLGISPLQVQALAERYAIYMADSSRISLAGLNSGNIDYFCRALHAVVAGGR